jgi:hypothetical protein
MGLWKPDKSSISAVSALVESARALLATIDADTGSLNTDRGKFLDTDGAYNAFKMVDGQPRTVNSSYENQIAEGNVTGHTAWTKIGYTPTMTTAISDIWSNAGAYVFPAAAAKWDVLGVNAADLGTSIFSGTTSGGGLTSIIDATKNFKGGTAVEVGDCVILDKSGTTPEWGYVTAVDTTTLTIGGGFSSGGTGYGTAGRAYAVIDKNTAGKTGAHAVKIEYLTITFAEKSEIVIMNGAAAVDTINTDFYRVNSFRIIATGSSNACVAAISLRVSGGAVVYSYITAGYTRARNSAYTVPYGKTLYINEFTAAFATTGNANKEYARIFTRANIEPSTRFRTGSLFYPYSEVVAQNTTIAVRLPIPTKITTGTDIKVGGIASAAGIATSVLRGWLE